MSPRPRGNAVRVLAILLALAAAPAGAEVRFAIAGEVLQGADFVTVGVILTNQGDAPAATVTVTGTLQGHQETGTLAGGLLPARSGTIPLRFPADAVGMGVRALDLLVDWTQAVPAGTVSGSERAYLLLGTPTPDRVRVTAAAATLETAGPLVVSVASVDGAPHRTRVRVSVPRGLQAPDVPPEVMVPPKGSIDVPVRLLRSSAPRPSRLGVVVFAETEDGGVPATAVTTSTVAITPDPAVLPRNHRALAILAGLLLGAAALRELWSARRPTTPA